MNDMDNNVQESMSTPEHFDTTKLTWIIIVGLVIVLCVYFYVAFLIDGTTKQSEPKADLTEEQVESQTQILKNEELRQDAPREQIEIPSLNNDILRLAISNEVGRYFVLPTNNQTLYVNTIEKCVDVCLENWTPYTLEFEITDGDIRSEYRDDIDAWQILWRGEALYTHVNDSRNDRFKGEGIDNSWQIARP